jgi:hypothetical protein
MKNFKASMICLGAMALHIVPIAYAVANDSLLLGIVLFVSWMAFLVASAYFVFQAERDLNG